MYLLALGGRIREEESVSQLEQQAVPLSVENPKISSSLYYL